MAIPLLLGNHLAVNGIMGQELIMGSQGIHLPVFKDKDTVGILNGANALGDDEFGGIGQITAKSLLDGRIGQLWHHPELKSWVCPGKPGQYRAADAAPRINWCPLV